VLIALISGEDVRKHEHLALTVSCRRLIKISAQFGIHLSLEKFWSFMGNSIPKIELP